MKRASLHFAWEIIEGGGELASTADQQVEYAAPATPGLTRLKVQVTQREVTCAAGALLTITDSLEASVSTAATVNARGLPGIPSSARRGSFGARASMPNAISSS